MHAMALPYRGKTIDKLANRPERDSSNCCTTSSGGNSHWGWRKESQWQKQAERCGSRKSCSSLHAAVTCPLSDLRHKHRWAATSILYQPRRHTSVHATAATPKITVETVTTSAKKDHGLGSAAYEAFSQQDEVLTEEEVNNLIAEAAGIIAVLDELRPLDRTTYNAAYEIWKLIARIPEGDRHRLLEDLAPGSIRALWKHSVARYTLDDARAVQLFSHHNVWDDFPAEAGEVYGYEGRCEQYVYRPPTEPFEIDKNLQSKMPRSTPWLRPAAGTFELPQDRFSMAFFRNPRTGQLHGRLQLGAGGPWGLLSGLLERWWQREATYCRADVALTLTPLPGDAGADISLVYPMAGEPPELYRSDLPHGSWPPPAIARLGSPFSRTSRDFVRAAGPGVYVGCAYRHEPGRRNELMEPNFVYFVLARQHS